MPNPNVYSGNQNATTQQAASELQYGGDPRQAMINAILNSGGNPFSSSPFMKMLLAMAPGLQATEYLTNIGAKPGDIQGMGGTGQMFGDFLKNALSSGQNLYQTLGNTAQQLPQFMNQMRDYQNNVKDGSIQNGDISPFAAMLDSQLQDPQGMGNLMTSLRAPGLGSLARPWAGALQDVLSSKYNTMANDFGKSGDMLNPPNFIDYIFGRG